MCNIICQRLKPDSNRATSFSIFIYPFRSKFCKAGIINHSKILILNKPKLQSHIFGFIQLVQIFGFTDCLCDSTVEVIIINFTFNIERSVSNTIFIFQIFSDQPDSVIFRTVSYHCSKFSWRKVQVLSNYKKSSHKLFFQIIHFSICC